ncbi:Nucleotide-diphospho-sugar transferase [Gracilaria domingensis]|nr:Nucleotide-diphospho-sugar transferase [Gracilaria domingensis]
MLREALASWLDVRLASEIIIVDWSSEPPLRPIVDEIVSASNSSVRVRLIRVDNEPEWVLSRSYNLAVHHATNEIVFKVDCDYVMHRDAIAVHPLKHSQSLFYTGFYMNSRNANEMHLNGALVVSQTRFWSIGGYDERIQTYGFDDDDLYERLEASGAERLNVSFDHFTHISHEDKIRTQEGVRFPRVQIDINRLILEKIGQPWNKTFQRSQYEQVEDNPDLLRANYIPPALKTLVTAEEYTEIRRLSLGRRMHDDYGMPWGIIQSMASRAAEIFLDNMNKRKKAMGIDEVIDGDVRPRFVLIHVQNGLGNRLRSMGSGISFAEKTGREPIVIWEKDEHFDALYSDIFDDSDVKFPVMDEFEPTWPLAGNIQYDTVWGDIDYYNYMLQEDVGKFIVDNPDKSIYFKSSAIMNSNVTTWASENEPIRKLPVRKDIISIASPIYSKGMAQVGGVHIRNRSLDEDIPGADNRGMYYEEDAALLDKWRATTKMDNFVGTIRAMLNNGTVQKFFVASDTVQVCRRLKDMFGEDRIMYIDRECNDRGTECEKYAMADLLVLSKVKVLLGSTWSSFTGAAMRLGGPKALLAGTCVSVDTSRYRFAPLYYTVFI